ncbi:uncharacterized protein BDZ99DRAFT_447950 [Mytilinidion resinicola]|uniref:BTB domain-containing protein n=1 Tax=Mytilinidion resinicola TaxID=574789 RepID=A0A6A6YFP5_9PEZI|nr:uncharacterized protein BDZ99DRAFT_447950 [Mytilinidion resinicola]KAF2807560.1 hypothetical protein BDZ99DRAFT_447950 [Mytilinidion resinicola]
MAEASRKKLLDSLKGSFASSNYSDLIITCGSDSYNVHKMIVCSRCDFFARAVRFSVGKEAHDGKIDLPEDEPAIVKLLMQYLYEGEYDPALPPEAQKPTMEFPHSCSTFPYHRCCSTVCPHHTCGIHCGANCRDFTCKICSPPLPPLYGTADQLLTHAKMYEIGEKYDVIGLKDLSQEKFSRTCGLFWNDPKFPVAAHHAFSTTPDHDKGLRDLVFKTLSDHLELIDKPEIEAVLTEFNGLAFGLLKEKKQQGWR